MDSVGAGDFGLSAVGNFEKSTFSFVEAKLAQQRRRFEHLTQVIPTGSEGKFAKLSPAVVLSEIVAKMSAANTKVVELRKQVSDQEQVVTEEEKSLVDGKISATATEVAKVQQERELSNSKLSESYSAIKTLDTLTERAHEIFSTISAASHTKALLAVAADRVLQAENALRTAEKENVSFFRELALYTIGFK